MYTSSLSNNVLTLGQKDKRLGAIPDKGIKFI